MTTQKLLQRYGTQLLFADATDFPSSGLGPPATAANSLIIGTPTKVQMNMSTIAAAAAWESAKTATLVDVGASVGYPREWVLGACMESTATPAAGGTFDFYWNASPNSTAGTGNSGGTSGTDSAYTYTASSLKQLIFIGSMTVRANVLNIEAVVGKLILPFLYGSLIVVNNTSVAMQADGVADQTHVVLTPVIPDLQAAA